MYLVACCMRQHGLARCYLKVLLMGELINLVCPVPQVQGMQEADDCVCLVSDVFWFCRLISFVEFRTFEALLCAPDAINQLAFKLFDLENKGSVSFGKPLPLPHPQGQGRNCYGALFYM